MSGSFPTFARLAQSVWFPGMPLARWLSTPWWPADTLASKQYALLRVIYSAATERLELAPLVDCLGKEHRWSYRYRLRRLAGRLASGTALPDALEQTPGALSEEQMLAVRFGRQSGSLPETLRSLLDQRNPTADAVGHRLRQLSFYATGMTLFFLFIVTFLVIKILPSLDKIMDDFSESPPEPFRLMNGLSTFFVHYWFLFVFAWLILLWSAKSAISRRFFRRRVWSRLFKPVVKLRSACLLNLLAVAQEAGRPLPAVLSTLARYHYDSLIRHRLLFVRNEVEQGAPLWQSLATAGLLSPAEARALTNSEPIDTTVWTLLQLAEAKRNRLARRLAIGVDLLLPIVVLIFAAFVLLTALAIWTPLLRLVGGF